MDDVGKDKEFKNEKSKVVSDNNNSNLWDTLSEIKKIFADQTNQAASMDNLKDKMNAFIEKQEDNIDLML